MTANTLQRARLPQIPSLDGITDPVARNVLAAIVEIIQVREGVRSARAGNELEQAVTFRDLYENGMLNSGIDGLPYFRKRTGDLVGSLPANDSVSNEYVEPPAPTGFTATGAIANVILQWDEPRFNNYAYTEVWRADTDDISLATIVGQPSKSVASDPLGQTAVTRYYWIRHVNAAKVPGPFNASAGTAATTGTVDSGDLTDGAVTTTKIASAAVTNAKIGLLAVDTANIAAAAVVAAKIADATITTAKIANAAITTALINDAAITSAKINDAAITTAKIGDAEITNAKIANATITGGKIAAATISADKLTVSTLSAITADLGTITAGTITLDSSGHIKSGQTAYDTGTGFWLGIVSGVAKMSIGDSSANKMTWDGSTLSVRGDINLKDYTAGSNLFISSDAVKTTVESAATKLKEIVVTRYGTVTVYFELRENSGAGPLATAYGRIYKNGTATGTLRGQIEADGWGAWSEDITVSPGDLVQIYAYEGSGSGAYQAEVRNFRLKCGFYVNETVTLA